MLGSMRPWDFRTKSPNFGTKTRQMRIALSKPQTYASGVLLVIVAVICSSLSGVFVRLMPELDGWQISCWRGYWMSVSLMIYLILRYGSGISEVLRMLPREGLLAVTLFFL